MILFRGAWALVTPFLASVTQWGEVTTASLQGACLPLGMGVGRSTSAEPQRGCVCVCGCSWGLVDI